MAAKSARPRAAQRVELKGGYLAVHWEHPLVVQMEVKKAGQLASRLVPPPEQCSAHLTAGWTAEQTGTMMVPNWAAWKAHSMVELRAALLDLPTVGHSAGHSVAWMEPHWAA